MATLVLGILLVVFGFYGSPISWSNYSKKKSLRVVLRLILNENLYSVEELSEQTNKRKREIVSMINTLILKEYLTGYKFKGEILELNTNKKQSAKVTRKQKCDVCGGMMKFDGVHFVCEYCGNVTKEK